MFLQVYFLCTRLYCMPHNLQKYNTLLHSQCLWQSCEDLTGASLPSSWPRATRWTSNLHIRCFSSILIAHTAYIGICSINSISNVRVRCFCLSSCWWSSASIYKQYIPILAGYSITNYIEVVETSTRKYAIAYTHSHTYTRMHKTHTKQQWHIKML